jgi:N-acetylglucosaminyldiphosphoundecaprenol N-acetyl-beta-D-mannosaminyltransferase
VITVKETPVENVIGVPISALSFKQQVEKMMEWAKARKSRSVCIANVHMLIEAHHDSQFEKVLQEADLVTPDGMPLVWMLRIMGVQKQDRVAGLDVLAALCEAASREDVSIYFVGSQQEILDRMRTRLEREYPKLKIAGMEPLPFRPLTPEEDEELVEKLNRSGAGIVMVSLGCPKQERWMAEHKGKVEGVMIGLGGAFPVYAGLLKRAPVIVRASGLEWLYRLIQEPQRLWRRYVDTIPVFIWLACKQVLTASKVYECDRTRRRVA